MSPEGPGHLAMLLLLFGAVKCELRKRLQGTVAERCLLATAPLPWALAEHFPEEQLELLLWQASLSSFVACCIAQLRH